MTEARGPAAPDGIELLRRVDSERIAGTPASERLVQRLIGPGSATGSCTISWIRTPPGGGSPEGLHVHPVDQIFYLLEGTMSVEARGETFNLEPGSLVVLPAGLAHRNWNPGVAPSAHLAINVPEPPTDVPFARPAEA